MDTNHKLIYGVVRDNRIIDVLHIDDNCAADLLTSAYDANLIFWRDEGSGIVRMAEVDVDRSKLVHITPLAYPFVGDWSQVDSIHGLYEDGKDPGLFLFWKAGNILYRGSLTDKRSKHFAQVTMIDDSWIATQFAVIPEGPAINKPTFIYSNPDHTDQLIRGKIQNNVIVDRQVIVDHNWTAVVLAGGGVDLTWRDRGDRNLRHCLTDGNGDLVRPYTPIDDDSAAVLLASHGSSALSSVVIWVDAA